MFTIDLLKGTGKPPLSHPVRMAGVTVAFALVAIAAVLDVARYSRDNIDLGLQARSLRYYTEEVAKLSDVAKTLDAAEKRKSHINSALAEVNKALGLHTQWSPLLVALAAGVPDSIAIADLMAKREEAKGKYEYSLIMGVVSPTGPAAVEQTVRALRQALPLVSGPDSVRIISQRQQQMEGRDFQYYVIECQLKL